MLNITFKGEPFLFTGDALEDGGAITTPENFAHGLVSYAHYFPGNGGRVQRYHEVIGTGADLVVVGPAEPITMTLGDYVVALDNMLGGDPGWFSKPAKRE